MPRSKVKRKKTKVGLFVGTLLTTLGVFLGVFVVAAAGFNFLATGGANSSTGPDGTRQATASEQPRIGFIQNLLPIQRQEPKRSFALILGVDDDGTRTDTMIVAAFDPVTTEITLVSLPRDSRVIMPPERANQIRELGGWVPADNAMKLNEVHSYAQLGSKDLAAPFAKAQVEDILGIEIDYYVRVDLDAFKFLVDQIGGVHFNVPMRMYYHDPTQNLLIDLQPGLQLLNGQQALNMVRFRGYPGGDDFARMRTQQDFIRAFVNQAMDVDSIMQNIPAFIGATLMYVDTDFGLTDIPGYLPYLTSFNPGNITSYTLPHSHTQRINGQDFVILNEAAVREMVEELFMGRTEAVVDIPSDGLRIQVLNGGGVSGLARYAQDLLELNGFTDTVIGDYQGVRADQTRIFVSRRGMGSDIRDILKNSTVIFDPAIDPRYDIVVVIGRLGLD